MDFLRLASYLKSFLAGFVDGLDDTGLRPMLNLGKALIIWTVMLLKSGRNCREAFSPPIQNVGFFFLLLYLSGQSRT